MKQLAALKKELKEVKNSCAVTPPPLRLPAKRKPGDKTVASTPTLRKLRSGGGTLRSVQAPDNEEEGGNENVEDDEVEDDGGWLNNFR